MRKIILIRYDDGSYSWVANFAFDFEVDVLDYSTHSTEVNIPANDRIPFNDVQRNMEDFK